MCVCARCLFRAVKKMDIDSIDPERMARPRTPSVRRERWGGTPSCPHSPLGVGPRSCSRNPGDHLHKLAGSVDLGEHVKRYRGDSSIELLANNLGQCNGLSSLVLFLT